MKYFQNYQDAMRYHRNNKATTKPPKKVDAWVWYEWIKVWSVAPM